MRERTMMEGAAPTRNQRKESAAVEESTAESTSPSDTATATTISND